MNVLVDYFLHLLYPPKCMFCGELLRDEDAEYCEECFHSLPEYEGADRTVPGFDQAVATFSYRDPIRYTILRYKFYGMKCYGARFARWMAITVRDKVKEPCDLISWVPCSTLRKWSRGYDQAEILARALAVELGMEVRPVLRKKRHNTAQSRIKGEARRKANVLGVYIPYRPESWTGKRILLIDDVLTTGATLGECARILHIAGSDGLVCAVVAAASGDNEKTK